MSDFYQPQNFGEVADHSFATKFNVISAMIERKRQNALEEMMLPLQIKRAQAEITGMEALAKERGSQYDLYSARAKALGDAASVEIPAPPTFGESSESGTISAGDSVGLEGPLPVADSGVPDMTEPSDVAAPLGSGPVPQNEDPLSNPLTSMAVKPGDNPLNDFQNVNTIPGSTDSPTVGDGGASVSTPATTQVSAAAQGAFAPVSMSLGGNSGGVFDSLPPATKAAPSTEPMSAKADNVLFDSTPEPGGTTAPAAPKPQAKTPVDYTGRIAKLLARRSDVVAESNAYPAQVHATGASPQRQHVALSANDQSTQRALANIDRQIAVVQQQAVAAAKLEKPGKVDPNADTELVDLEEARKNVAALKHDITTPEYKTALARLGAKQTAWNNKSVKAGTIPKEWASADASSSGGTFSSRDFVDANAAFEGGSALLAGHPEAVKANGEIYDIRKRTNVLASDLQKEVTQAKMVRDGLAENPPILDLTKAGWEELKPMLLGANTRGFPVKVVTQGAKGPEDRVLHSDGQGGYIETPAIQEKDKAAKAEKERLAAAPPTFHPENPFNDAAAKEPHLGDTLSAVAGKVGAVLTGSTPGRIAGINDEIKAHRARMDRLAKALGNPSQKGAESYRSLQLRWQNSKDEEQRLLKSLKDLEQK